MADKAADKVAGKADLEALAERYLDLWQDQLTAMAADADFATVIQNMFGPAAWPPAAGHSPSAAWQAMMAQYTPAPQAERGADERADKNDGASAGPGQPGGPAAPVGAAPAAPASERGGAGLDDIVRRLAALEARIAALEDGRRGSGAKGSARRKRS